MPQNGHPGSSIYHIIVPYEESASGAAKLGAILFSGNNPGLASENRTDWTSLSGLPMTAAATIRIEVLDALVQNHVLTQLLSAESLRGTPFEQAIVSLMQRLITIPDGDHGEETEEFAFHIFELPPGTPNIKPGTYVEVSHGDTIAENAEWWQEMDDGLPGTVFGHISIEVYKKMFLPEAVGVIEKYYDGEPEDLENLVGDDIISLFQRITGQ